MKKIIVILTISLVSIFNIFSVISFPANADVKCPEGTKRAGVSVKDLSICNLADDSSTNSSISTTLTNTISVIIGIISFLAIVIIIISGFKITTSQGDSAKVAQARKAILFSVIGLVVALLAFTIVNTVSSRITGGV